MSDQLKLVFLGTGASVPMAYRALASLAIIREGQTFLIDCGEGTQTQIQRTNIHPGKIEHIFITHLHGDHIFGLPGFITSQNLMERQAPLTIYGPVGIQKFITGIQDVCQFNIKFPLNFVEIDPDNIEPFRIDHFTVHIKPLEHRITTLGYRFVEDDKPGVFDLNKAASLGIPRGPLFSQLQNGQSISIGDKTIQPDEVLGPPQKGRIIAMCTDTKPCENSLELAKNCSVLIHDSTFSDEQTNRAEVTFHSTCTQSAEIAQKANAEQLVLWHTSSRNNNGDQAAMLDQTQKIFPNSIMPRDGEELVIKRSL